MEWFAAHILLVTALVLSAAGVFILLPKRAALPRPLGWLLVLAGGVSLAATLAPDRTPLTEDFLFYLFSGIALGSAVLMLSSHNPVYGALWFALATLSVCGLFLLQSAPFLAAATVIVYAGAIIVTFLFVIMLAQQSGLSIYDQRSRQPFLATCAAFVLLGALLATIEKTDLHVAAETQQASADVIVTNALSHPTGDEALGSLQGLGRSLFGDYLFAVELAGTLLLIASIGAIIVAPRKGQVT
ncbi:NADH-quinone oxidoreductase subunit J family protein [Planctomicrobium sp. SH661]|uniref:NADH-quinone oxidoreductase subunit J family protein n=1 Tax=Planctomicrobium sp. SH661 TaxID=3448124 RepID=UPI003F5BC245